MRDQRILGLLVCPICHGPLQWRPEAQELLCRTDRLAFPVQDGVPMMLEGEARPLSADEVS